MIVIAEQYARFQKSLPSSRLDSSASALLEFSEAQIFPYYKQNDRKLPVAVYVRVEVGSTKVWIITVTVVNALISYGNIRQSADYLVKDAKSVAQLVLPGAPKVIGLDSDIPATVRRRTGIPGELQRLFRAVERHEISADAATRSAVNLLYKAEGPNVVDEVPTLIEQLSAELHAATQNYPTAQAQLDRKLDSQYVKALLEADDVATPLPAPKPAPIQISYDALPAPRKTGSIASRSVSGNVKVTRY